MENKKPEWKNLDCGCAVIEIKCVDGEIVVLKKHCNSHMPKPVDFDNTPPTKDIKWKY